MKKAIFRAANFFLLLLKIHHPISAFRLSKFKSYQDFNIDFSIKNGNLYFPEKGLSITPAQQKSFSHNLFEICRLARCKYLTSIQTIQNSTYVNLNYKGESIKLNCNNLDNLLIINELFTDEIYEFNLNKSIVCIDIGMNVGYSSLLFSMRNDVEKIYAYEPFKGTYENALANINLNENLKSKIEPINEGWSNKTGDFEFQSYEDGSVGASTSFTADLNPYGKIGNLVKVKLKDASEELKKIKSLHPDKGIFIKMDCEGSEYEIFEKLNADHLLHLIDGLLIEWHYKGPSEITDILEKNNFSYYSTGRPDSPFIGFIYAFKK